jgi:hypothetical protein
MKPSAKLREKKLKKTKKKKKNRPPTHLTGANLQTS